MPFGSPRRCFRIGGRSHAYRDGDSTRGVCVSSTDSNSFTRQSYQRDAGVGEGRYLQDLRQLLPGGTPRLVVRVQVVRVGSKRPVPRDFPDGFLGAPKVRPRLGGMGAVQSSPPLLQCVGPRLVTLVLPLGGLGSEDVGRVDVARTFPLDQVEEAQARRRPVNRDDTLPVRT